MQHITANIPLESTAFPFNMFDGHGFSGEASPSMHNHDCLELNYVSSGEGTYLIGENQYPIRQGDLFVINNCEYHAAIDKGELTLKVIVFSPDMVWQNNNILDYKYLQTFFEWKDSFKHHFASDNPMVAQIAALFYEIEREWSERQEGYRLVIKALLLQMLSLLYRGFAQAEDTSQKVLKFQNDYNRIAEAVSFLDNHFSGPVTLNLLSNVAHMSPTYFSKIFNRLMSKSVSAYLNEKRLSYACLLLKTTQKNVCEVALQSGFGDIPYFNRLFKAQLGCTPKQYRAKQIS